MNHYFIRKKPWEISYDPNDVTLGWNAGLLSWFIFLERSIGTFKNLAFSYQISQILAFFRAEKPQLSNFVCKNCTNLGGFEVL